MTDANRPYDTELAELRGMLRPDGYDIEVVGNGGNSIDLRVVVTSPEACADCLVPKPIMREVISARLTPHDLRLGELTYPTDAAPEGVGGGSGADRQGHQHQ